MCTLLLPSQSTYQRQLIRLTTEDHKGQIKFYKRKYNALFFVVPFFLLKLKLLTLNRQTYFSQPSNKISNKLLQLIDPSISLPFLIFQHDLRHFCLLKVEELRSLVKQQNKMKVNLPKSQFFSWILLASLISVNQVGSWFQKNTILAKYSVRLLIDYQNFYKLQKMEDTEPIKNGLAIPRLIDLSPQNVDELDFDISNSGDTVDKQKQRVQKQKRRYPKLVIDSLIQTQQNSVILEGKEAVNNLIKNQGKIVMKKASSQSEVTSEKYKQFGSQNEQMSPFPYIPQQKQKQMNLKSIIKKIVYEGQEN